MPAQHSTRRGHAAASALAAGLAVALLLVSGIAHAADPPRIYALTGATVTTEPGRTLESATLVVRNGLVEAVGKGVEIPPDAVVIDVSDRFIYPGLIDADSGLGIAAREDGPRSTAPGGARGGDTRPGAIHPVALIHPELRARDRLQPFEGDRKRDAERIRELGFTVVLATPGDGVLRGRSVAILLDMERPVAEMILRDDVAQHAAFERGSFGQGYPTSLMGAVAAMRQVFLDADRHRVWTARYEANPLGMERPEQHAAYEALDPVLRGVQPLVILTEDPLDTLLADRIATEFDLELIVSVAGHEWEIVEQVAAIDRRLILTAGFPDKPDVREEDEALGVTVREMRRFLEAPTAAAKLDAAGVEFALTLRGLKNTADFRKNMAKIIDAGLSEDVALDAWTRIPARMLGIERTAGTLEPGKIANMVVADGPLFGEDTEVREVWVDGVRHEIEVKETKKGDPNAVVDPRGEWSVVFDIGGRTIQRAWTIEGSAGDYSGTAEIRSGTVSFESVTLEGNMLTVVFPPQEGRPASEVLVIIEGESFEGNVEMGPRSVELSGTRTSGPQGGGR